MKLQSLAGVMGRAMVPFRRPGGSLFSALLLALLSAAPAPQLKVAAQSAKVEGNDAYRILSAKHVCLVIEGMTGHAEAATAAQVTADAFAAAIAGPTKEALAAAASKASAKVYQEASKKPKLRGMGSLLVAAAVDKDRVFIAHVGDCRAWRLRAGTLTQVTEDHSLLNDYLKTRKLTPEEIEAFPHKNVVVRAVGVKPDVKADVREEKLEQGDRYLLSSSGLHKQLSNEEIAKALSGSEPAKALVAAAAKVGKTDATVIVLEAMK